MRIRVANLVPVFTGAGDLQLIDEADSESISRKVRESFVERASDFESWASLIRSHLHISPAHPFVKFLKMRNIPEADHLWTLGALAFGAQNQWIVIQEIQWDNGDVSHPEVDAQRWLGGLAGALVSK